MGLLDLPGPVFDLIDQALATLLPGIVRLALWGILCGWLTLLVYRRLSNQDRIRALKAEQKAAQERIAGFDGEFALLFPLIRHTIGLGLRQLGLSLGPALLASIPALFVLVWVSGRFGYDLPAPGDNVRVTAVTLPGSTPAFDWLPAEAASATTGGWDVRWPSGDKSVALRVSDVVILQLPIDTPVPIVHQRRWWNRLVANPIGYLPDAIPVERVSLALPAQQFLPFGPDWMRGWLFSFFVCFLLSSVAFKRLLDIE